jgi:hypothetical protein
MAGGSGWNIFCKILCGLRSSISSHWLAARRPAEINLQAGRNPNVRKTTLIVSLFITLIFTAAAQQQPAAKPAAKTTAKPAAARAEQTEASTELPVTRVSLYKNGVGFFEHAGEVTGDQSVTIDFTTAQLNDVLQSLTAIDLNGGRIAGAGYNSTTPLDQQLKALPLALGEDASAVDFYNAIRGARVEMRFGSTAITGRLLNIEEVNTPEGDNKPALDKRMITVIGEGGEVRTVELTPATSVTLLDTDLHQDVTRYLELLASTRNQGLRHLTLQDNGTGTRELNVSYISEVPIWKSTYRILFTEPKAASATTTQTATLQGWSVVDNTTGEDWINVQLSLIAGAPQSFIQPLSVPYYSRRPQIGLPQEAQLTPQTHESGETVAQAKAAPAAAGVAGMAGSVSSPISSARAVTGMGSGSGSGMGGGVAGGIFGGTGQNNLNMNYVEGNAAASVLPAPPPPLYEQSAVNSIAPKTTTAAFDDYFAYNLTEPITIRKNESALVPILQTKIDAERVTLWSQRQPTPLRALWITNTSKLTLDRGSFTIVEDGNFGGEGLLEPIHPDERRLLSYAVDQAVRVNIEQRHNNMQATSFTASKGVMVLRQTQTTDVSYLVHNAATEARTVILEHSILQGYTLDNGSGSNKDPKPEETTATVYRFRVNAGAGESLHLHVTEHHQSSLSYQLANFNDSQLTFIMNQTNNSEAIKQALQPILDARRHVAEMQVALDKANERMNALQSDEERQRANVTALASADKVSRERFVHDLNATEDQIAGAQKEQNTAQANLQAAKDDLANKIQSLQIDQTL